MKAQILYFTLLCSNISQAVIFNGLTETSISKNNFLCPVNSSSSVSCTNTSSNAQGFNFSSSKMLQIFNDQAFWLHEQAAQKKYASEALSYSGSELEAKMNADGWGAMGSYCIIVSIDPILTSIVQPNLKAKQNEQKVVVQLWYNGDNILQLWSQDAKVLSISATFSVAISNATDALSDVMNAQSNESKSLSETFLSELHLQQNSRKESVYQIATQSPRSVKIQES